MYADFLKSHLGSLESQHGKQKVIKNNLTILQDMKQPH